MQNKKEKPCDKITEAGKCGKPAVIHGTYIHPKGMLFHRCENHVGHLVNEGQDRWA